MRLDLKIIANIIKPQAKVLDEKELKKVIQFIDAFDRH